VKSRVAPGDDAGQLRSITKSGLRLHGCPLIVIALCIAAAVARADESIPAGKMAVLKFEPNTTEIDYSLNGWPHHTQGSFKLRRGVIYIDPTNGRIDGEIIVDAASGNSNESARDARMRSSILETSRFPDIIFRPMTADGSAKLAGDFKADVSGIMLLHGRSHMMSVVALIGRDGDLVHIESEFEIPFVAWGLEDPSILMLRVDKEVHIKVIATPRLSWIARK